MPIDWNTFDQDADAALQGAKKATDDQLASKISSITRLTDEEIKGLFPTPAEAKTLIELMKIVKSAEDQNVKTRRLIEKVEEIGGTAIKLLERLV